MASEHRAYRSAPVRWAGQRLSTSSKSTLESSWNLQVRTQRHCELSSGPGLGQRGALFSPPEDGLQDLQLGGPVLVDPHVDQFIQPGGHM